MKKILGIIFLLFFWSTAQAERIDQVVYFGDSLTDNGNLYSLLNVVPKSPPYYEGRFANGPIWSDELSSYLFEHAGIETKNYAMGGATTLYHSPFQGYLPYLLSDEINRYLIENLFANKSHTLFVIWIGANDYTGGQKDAKGATTDVVKQIMASINKLFKNGARHFLILNLPDFAKTPFAQSVDFAANLTDLSILHNIKLSTAVSDLRNAHADVKVAYLDIYTLFNNLIENPEAYNEKYHKSLKNLTDACWAGGYTLKKEKASELNSMRTELQKTLTQQKTKNPSINADYLANTPTTAEAYRVAKLYEDGITPCENPDNYLFWDKIHPTSAVHQVMATFAIQALIDAKIIE